jgi:hypothetical protein
MHQHAPLTPPVPQSNAVPQRAQARRRRGKTDWLGAGIIAALSGGIARKINHADMTGLGQPMLAVPYRPGAWLWPRSAIMIVQCFR